MNIRDRGKMKFAPALLPPELRQMLADLDEEDNYDLKPVLDQQQLEYFDQLICEVMEFNFGVRCVFHKNNYNHIITGTIHYYNEQRRTIRIQQVTGEWLDVELDSIVDLCVFDE